MARVIVGKWGRNLAVRLPNEIAEAAGLSAGDRTEIETRGPEIVIRRIAPPLTVEELFRGKSPQEWRALYKDAFGWGADVGREAVEE